MKSISSRFNVSFRLPMVAAMMAAMGGIAAAQQPAVTPMTPMVADALATAQSAYDASSGGHIRTFDTLDFDVYSNQRWDRFKESHAETVVVHYPDGHVSKRLQAHIDEMKPQFQFAPDTHVISHPVKIGSGEWTAVIGEGIGTLTKPMQNGPDKFIQPTSKKLGFQMVTIGPWNKDGVMDEEWLFWDNANLAKQIGLM